MLDGDEADLREQLEVVGDLAPMEIDALGPGHWSAVRAIYEAGIATGNATFETTVPDWEVHQACGFRVVGVRERLGLLHGRWRDVLLLERRSPAIS
jgi:L-amino acid N-acyltransferase YncA